jgi:hypothetical protein
MLIATTLKQLCFITPTYWGGRHEKDAKDHYDFEYTYFIKNDIKTGYITKYNQRSDTHKILNLVFSDLRVYKF